jgi:hypothetical protein
LPAGGSAMLPGRLLIRAAKFLFFFNQAWKGFI